MGEPESFPFSCNQEVICWFVCYICMVIQLGKEVLWLRVSRGAICYVGFPVLLCHSRQCTPEYSGVRETALIDLGCWAGERQ